MLSGDRMLMLFLDFHRLDSLQSSKSSRGPQSHTSRSLGRCGDSVRWERTQLQARVWFYVYVHALTARCWRCRRGPAVVSSSRVAAF